MTFYKLMGKCIAYFCRTIESSKEITIKCGSGSFRKVWVTTDSEPVKTVRRRRRNKDYYSLYKRLLNDMMDNQY
jgi:hypothetical protein